MFLMVGLCFLALLSITLFMLWAHEKITNKRIIPHARVEECWTNEERRRHVRFERDLEVEYYIEKKPHLKTGNTVNVSRGGMKLLLDEKLPVGTIIDLKALIPVRNRTVEIEAKVVWTKEAQNNDPHGKRFFHSGIKFIAIKEPSDAHFSEYINSLERHG